MKEPVNLQWKPLIPWHFNRKHGEKITKAQQMFWDCYMHSFLDLAQTYVLIHTELK